MTTKKITNTAKDEVRPDWIMGGNPNAILNQEARGQDELVNSMQLPVDIRGDRKILEQDGVQFGAVSSNDPLFCHVTLPSGWVKRKTDHSMWSELVDASGNVRANIFYKAASYDRDAFMNITAD